VVGRVRLDAVATAHLSRFDLDAAGLDIAGVRVGDSPAGIAQVGEEHEDTPAAPLRKGRRFAVVVDYAADPRAVPQPVGGFVPTADGFATAAQPAGAHTVFPCNDHPSDKSAYVVRITAPGGLMGVANGALVSSTPNPDGSTTWTYRSRDPLATELVQLSVGRYTVVERAGEQAGFLRDVVPPLRLPGTAALSLTPGQLTWVVGQLGPFPLEGYGILVADTDDPKRSTSPGWRPRPSRSTSRST
jgi:aminopeptidase N